MFCQNLSVNVKYFLCPTVRSKYLRNMNACGDYRTKVVLVTHSFFKTLVSIALLPFIIVTNQSQSLFAHVDHDHQFEGSSKNHNSL